MTELNRVKIYSKLPTKLTLKMQAHSHLKSRQILLVETTVVSRQGQMQHARIHYKP